MAEHYVESKKDIATLLADLETSVKNHKFGVLHVYDLKDKMKEKGLDLKNECRIVEICNPAIALSVLNNDMDFSLALPCRISVYEKDGKVKMGTVLPSQMIKMFSGVNDKVLEVAASVEKTMEAIMKDAA